MISKSIPIPLGLLLYIPYLNVFYEDTLRETQPNLPYHFQSSKKDSKIEFWVVERTYIPSEAKKNPLEHWKCYVADINQGIGTRK